METINSFIGTVVGQIGAAFLTILGQIALFALIGLAVSVLILYFGRKQGWFSRPFSLWSGVAKLYYIYLPILLIAFGVSAGVLSGIHSATGNIIDGASEQVIAYGQAFIVDFKAFMAKTSINKANADIAVIVDKYLEENTELGWFSKMALKGFNTMFVEMFLEAMGVSGQVEDPDVLSKAFETKDLPTAFVSMSSSVLHTKHNIIFWAFFLGLWGVFSTFFLLPVIEFAMHFVVGFFIKSKSTAPNAAPMI